MAEDYIKFLENPSQYLKLDLKQCSWENVPFKQSLVDGAEATKKSLGKSLDDMVIAQLGDIYIVFCIIIRGMKQFQNGIDVKSGLTWIT